MARSKRAKRTGLLLFAIPIVAVIGLVIMGAISAYDNTNGTLVIEAQLANGSAPVYTSVPATVAGTTQKTPYNLSLPQGSYLVTYGTLKWYNPPSQRQITLEGGKTAYAIGVYTPTPVAVAISASGPNATSIAVEHGVTPVVWLNEGSVTLQLSSPSFSSAIPPGGNFTTVFVSPGTFKISFPPQGFDVMVTSY